LALGKKDHKTDIRQHYFILMASLGPQSKPKKRNCTYVHLNMGNIRWSIIICLLFFCLQIY